MIYIPEKHYVGFQHRNEGGQIILGFATPYATDTAFNKRKCTVDSWACSYQNIKAKDPNRRVSAILSNELLDGFEIARSVRRSGWNGGNVVWRIVDPRGFELEISSANLASILDCVTIVNGVIQGRCIWGRDGASNILLPEQSEPYKEAVKLTQLKEAAASKKISMRDVKIGNTIKLASDDDVQYLGKFYLVHYEWNDSGEEKTAKVVERYAYKHLTSNSVVLVSRVPLAAVVDSNIVVDTQTATQLIRDFIRTERFGAYAYATPTKITVDDVALSYEPMPAAPSPDDLQYVTKMHSGVPDYYSRYTPVVQFMFAHKDVPDKLQLITHQERLSRDTYNNYSRLNKTVDTPTTYPYDTIDAKALITGRLLITSGYYRKLLYIQKIDISRADLQWYKLVMYISNGDKVDKLRT